MDVPPHKVEKGRSVRRASTHALLHVFLPSHDGFLSYLEAHLRRLIVHEAPERGREGASGILLGLRLSTHLPTIWTVAVALGRWRGAHHWDGRDMLGDGVVERW